MAEAGRAALRTVAAATLVGAAMRFYDLGGHPFWLDENATFIDIHTLFGRDANSPVFVQGSNLLYYALLSGWASIFGESAAALRAFSALASTACIPAAARLARRLGGNRAAIFGAWLVALHPLHIHYAREARAYALWTLALLLAIDALWQASTRDTARSWAVAAIAWLAAFGTHVFTVFALPLSAAALLWSRDRARTRRHWLGFAAATGGAMALYAALVLAPSIAEGTGAWLEGTFEPLAAVPQTLLAMLPSGVYPLYIHPLSFDSMRSVPWAPPLVADLSVIVSLTLAAGSVLGLALLGRTDTQPESDWRPLAALALGPLLLQWLASFVSPIYFVARYDLVAWPAIVVLLAIGFAGHATSPARNRLLLGILILCTLVPIGRALRYSGGERWNLERAHVLTHEARAGDLVITFSDDDDLLAHALAQNGFEAEVRTFPGWLARQIAFLDTRRDLSPARTEDLARDAGELQRQVEASLARGARVIWVDDSQSYSARSARAVLFERLEAQLTAAGIQRVPLHEATKLYTLEKRREP